MWEDQRKETAMHNSFMGASINDVHNIPPAPLSAISIYVLFVRKFGPFFDPPPFCADVICRSPLTLDMALPYYRCDDGVCLDEKDLCDGVVHCRDGSDEERCDETTRWCSSSSEFGCRDASACVPERFLCDGTPQVGRFVGHSEF